MIMKRIISILIFLSFIAIGFSQAKKPIKKVTSKKKTTLSVGRDYLGLKYTITTIATQWNVKHGSGVIDKSRIPVATINLVYPFTSSLTFDTLILAQTFQDSILPHGGNDAIQMDRC